MKRSLITFVYSCISIVFLFTSCASDVDFDQVNTLKLEPVFIANLAYFEVPAPDFVDNGQEQSLVFDVPAVDVFSDKFFRDNLKKASIFTEMENTINRAYEVELLFLDKDNTTVYSANLNVPAYSGTVNKVNRTDDFENVQLDLLKRTTKIAFILRMSPGQPLTETSSGKLILRSGVTAYLVVE
ncbi:hypothetical protein IQ05_03018 [Flavobacterium tiangeerense]|uniref:DUF1735 domain-containing protein n=1 Tax=Flavobacterium tiangeerense TaxID=459471 RepID=A0ABY3FK09_9FLAO|nr:hypothetical protein [Flavobacterium tiangeerense]TWH99678.1 hypothetical protein IQ05_03018 [Flavobacterium tiangeerense]